MGAPWAGGLQQGPSGCHERPFQPWHDWQLPPRSPPPRAARPARVAAASGMSGFPARRLRGWPTVRGPWP